MILKLTKFDGTQEHTIMVEIDDDGNVAAKVEGVQGPACGDLSKFLDDLGEVTRDDPTGDYFQAASEWDTDVVHGW
jgi:hypothetical protein